MKIQLPRGRFLKLRQGSGSTVTTHAGSVWITEQDNPRDFVLRPGESFTFRRPGLALVEAFADASLSLESRITNSHPSPAEFPLERECGVAEHHGDGTTVAAVPQTVPRLARGAGAR